MSKTLRELADVHYGKSPNEVLSGEGDIPVFGTGGAYGCAHRALFAGPAVVVPRKGSLGNPQFVGTPFWASDTTYAVVPKPKVDAKWLYYGLDAFDLTRLNEATGVPSINRDWLYRIKLGDPGFPQQQRIAEILSTVDEAIGQTEALVGKWQQMKAGLMHDLFTRGVTPDGRLRPTRTQAPHLYQNSPLGWIPEEWEVVRLDECVAANRPIVYGILMPGTGYEGGIPVIKVKDIRDERVDLSDILLTSPEIDQLYARAKTKAGDVLFTIRGSVGRVAMVPDELDGANITQDTARISANNVDPSFLLGFLISHTASTYASIHTLGVAVQGINLGELRAMPVALPAASEQKILGSQIGAATDKINTEVEHLAKLRQQKQGLMHDLLTGRVRVNASERHSIA